MIEKWHQKIISNAEGILGRELSNVEREFITSRGGYIATEMIDDTVTSMNSEDLINYLNSEAGSNV